MRDMNTVVDQLRKVQQASRQFAERSAVERAFINPMLDCVTDDLLDECDRRHQASPYKWADTD